MFFLKTYKYWNHRVPGQFGLDSTNIHMLILNGGLVNNKFSSPRKEDSALLLYKRNRNGSILPDNEDSDSVDRADIYRILLPPRTGGGTARVALKLRFDAELEVAKW